MIPNSLVVTGGKGGVLKTSVTANLAGEWAVRRGLKILAVDLDPQGNLGRDLGYILDADDGRSMYDAVREGIAPVPMKEVRPNLDVLPGGKHLAELMAELHRRLFAGNLHAANGLRDAIARISSDYDLVLIDCPPGERVLQAASLRAGHYILLPTRADSASIDGLGKVALELLQEREANPWLHVLGVVLGPIGEQSTKIRSRAREQLGVELQGIPILDTVIPTAEKATIDSRDRGELAREHADAASRSRRVFSSGPAKKLATAYEALADEVLQRYIEEITVYNEKMQATGSAV